MNETQKNKTKDKYLIIPSSLHNDGSKIAVKDFYVLDDSSVASVVLVPSASTRCIVQRFKQGHRLRTAITQLERRLNNRPRIDGTISVRLVLLSVSACVLMTPAGCSSICILMPFIGVSRQIKLGFAAVMFSLYILVQCFFGPIGLLSSSFIRYLIVI